MKFPARHFRPLATLNKSTIPATRHARLITTIPRPLTNCSVISNRPKPAAKPQPEATHLRALHLTQSPSQRKTIYALATPPGKAGVAVIRISGPSVPLVLSHLIRFPSSSTRQSSLKPRTLRLAHIIDPTTNELLDEALIAHFPAPHSFTTEDVLELHTHGGRAIVSSVLEALAKVDGCRPAEPGEFTRRAFEGGRLDLTQVEGLRDLIDAETSAQRKLALRAAGGAMRKKYDALRERIIFCQAMVEAIIDFGEGEEIEDGVWETAQEKVSQLQSEIKRHLQDGRRGEILRNGIRLAIFGPPNAGKSSLLNFLAQREAAIVTPLPGTTRDVLEISLDIGGMPVIVADTAGLRKTSDLVESIGIERARAAVASADISLCVLSLPDLLSNSIPSSIRDLITPSTLILLNKTDLVPPFSSTTATTTTTSSKPVLGSEEHSWEVSVNTGEGMPAFLSGFTALLKERFDVDADGGEREPLITQARHRVHLESALGYLDAFMGMGPENVVFAAEELRYAAMELGKVSGAIGVEDILDTVFKEFCIGK